MSLEIIRRFQCDRCGVSLDMQTEQARPDGWLGVDLSLGASKQVNGRRLLCKQCDELLMEFLDGKRDEGGEE